MEDTVVHNPVVDQTVQVNGLYNQVGIAIEALVNAGESPEKILSFVRRHERIALHDDIGQEAK